jgi:transposase
MAMPVQPLDIGIDVSKADLAACVDPKSPVQTIPNTHRDITRWLQSLPTAPACLAVEATNTFHLELVERAHKAGHTVYLIDGYRLSHYRDSIGQRAKTDTSDAQLLQRYLSREKDNLHPWNPPPAGYTRLKCLLQRRAALVQARVALQQSLAGLPELKRSTTALLRQLGRLDTLIQKRMRDTLEQLDWTADADRCQAIEGIGPLTAAALTMTFRRGHFKNSDAFIAFLGLDVRVRDSGTMRGRRKLTKKGNPELRRLLFLAAMQASRSSTWKPFYQRYLDRGLAKIQALVILARKLARVAFALMKNQNDYQPKPPLMPCTET